MILSDVRFSKIEFFFSLECGIYTQLARYA